ncbi:TetR/AcrR family transcriptional regulator [Pseudonocardia sp. C8]|uniref:TetR/AcrR family transcriptional regulator n=1 Tax=Pseudonocardia sp. C8 TaxID=2762759 RepID=UPI00164269D8|nr:TetR/AcrR family transcriptional regulator [Pseudonocardia sp. C8]MBC3192020.1 TetR/AcrR family transcriptional regulator [Pseudonocardia sp. C8]
MGETTSERRPYRSDLRARQARETRRTVVEAATALFLRHGYAATTLDAVADRAGVSRKTVFNAVGGKAALLELAWGWSLVGDDEPVPMADRPAVHRILASTDPTESVRLWAAMVVETQERAAAIGRVLAAAADVDPDAAALLARADAERHDGARAFAEHLDRIGGLRPGIDRAYAADVCWAQNDGAAFRRLVLDRGWPPEAFREWLVRVLVASLLPGRAGGPSS